MLFQLVAAVLTCVALDGDTIRCNGETIRLQNVDTAELHGRCEYEIRLAQLAKEFTSHRLTEGAIQIIVDRSHPRDRYGRTIAWVKISGIDLGEELIAAGLARPWQGRRQTWC